jgi:hypothetical protein
VTTDEPVQGWRLSGVADAYAYGRRRSKHVKIERKALREVPQSE